MNDTTDALLDIVYELTVVEGVRLDSTALRECRRIFDGTVGFFAERAAAQGAASHPWDDEQFRDFILGQVRRIAKQLRATESTSTVDRDRLRATSHGVMLDTAKFCDLAMEKGRLKFSTKQWTQEGAVCSMYLKDTLLPWLPVATPD